MSFKAEIKTSLGWNWNEGAVDNNRLEYARQLLEGNGADQAEAVWHLENQTLSDTASTTFDLSALARTVFGDTHSVTLLTVKALLIVNESASGGGNLVVGGAASDEWSAPFAADGDKLSVPPDSPVLLAATADGWTVDATNKDLKLAASGGDVTYSIAMIGTTTAPSS